jgi:hypothetical protein
VLGQLHVRQGTAVVALVVLAACSQPAAGAGHGPSPSPAPSTSASLPACLDAPAPPPAPAGVRASVPGWVLASGLDQPDDVYFREGVAYVGELGNGHVDTVSPGLPPGRSSWTVPTPEGIAFIGDSEFVADQRDDRVDTIVGDQPRPVLQLQPVAGKDGVDGIGVQGDQLLVPDSPNGNLLWVDGFGRITRTVGGFTRPVGAWPLPDGSVLVADEYGNAAVKVAPDGSRSFLMQGLPIVDDIAAGSDGRVFVVTPVVSGGRLAELTGGQAVDLASGLLAPQGLALDGAGNLLATESSAGRLDLFIRNFKLVPVAGSPSPGQPVCVRVARAPGFTQALGLTAQAGVRVVSEPGAGDLAEVLIQPSAQCAKVGCEITASAGGLTDSLWITG